MLSERDIQMMNEAFELCKARERELIGVKMRVVTVNESIPVTSKGIDLRSLNMNLCK